jgi:hypothetical protein
MVISTITSGTSYPQYLKFRFPAMAPTLPPQNVGPPREAMRHPQAVLRCLAGRFIGF